MSSIPNRITLILLLLSSVWTGCTKLTELNLPESEPQLVLIAHPVFGQEMMARIGVTSPLYRYDTSSLNPVILLEGPNGFSERLNKTSAGWKTSHVLPEYGWYNVSMSSEGFTTVSARTYIPQPVTLETGQLFLKSDTSSASVEGGNRIFRVPLMMMPKQPEQSDSLFSFKITYSLIDKDERITENKEARFIANGPVAAYLYEAPDKSVIVHKKYWKSTSGPLLADAVIPLNGALKERVLDISVEWRTLSGDYYAYYLSLSRQADVLPFSSPDVLYNNVENGAGSFSGYSTLPQPYMWLL